MPFELWSNEFTVMLLFVYTVHSLSVLIIVDGLCFVLINVYAIFDILNVFCYKEKYKEGNHLQNPMMSYS